MRFPMLPRNNIKVCIHAVCIMWFHLNVSAILIIHAILIFPAQVAELQKKVMDSSPKALGNIMENILAANNLKTWSIYEVKHGSVIVKIWFNGDHGIIPPGASGHVSYKRKSAKQSQLDKDRAVAYKQRSNGQGVSTRSISKCVSNEIEQVRGGCPSVILFGLDTVISPVKPVDSTLHSQSDLDSMLISPTDNGATRGHGWQCPSHMFYHRCDRYIINKSNFNKRPFHSIYDLGVSYIWLPILISKHLQTASWRTICISKILLMPNSSDTINRLFSGKYWQW